MRSVRAKARLNYSELDDPYVDEDLTTTSASSSRKDDAEFSGDELNVEEGIGDRKLKRKREVSRTTKSRMTNNDRNFSSAGFDGASDQMLDHSSNLKLKSDHMSRPIWIAKDGVILLEAFSPLYQQAYDFLVAIAEPVARPQYVHKYRLTRNSLYAAVSINIDTETILTVMKRLCKSDLPDEVERFVRECTSTFGKAKLVLKDNNFFIESAHPDVLRKLLSIPMIAAARVDPATVEQLSGSNPSVNNINNDGFLETDALQELKQNLEFVEDGNKAAEGDDSDEDELEESSDHRGFKKLKDVSFMIKRSQVQEVKRCALGERYPLMEEYDFHKDEINLSLPIDMRPSTKIRAYQEKALAKMFGNGRARSGIIVLPCGAGKSLTGVTACFTLKKSTVVMCINNESVKQWKEQFKKFTTLPERCIRMFTSETKDQLPLSVRGQPPEACVLISSYSMMCHGGTRSEESQRVVDAIRNREWGLMLLDEVHVAPASMFRKTLELVNAHCKLGLTATLVREDDLIEDLNFLVGPKLYEANWMDLTSMGYLANVQCCEVWCPMTSEFYDSYLENTKNKEIQKRLYVLNPNKVRVCEFLIKTHLERGDKIIIFSDDLTALELYCVSLKIHSDMDVPFIWGETDVRERSNVLNAFKNTSLCNVIGLSKVGDIALDLPEANVIVQISSHFASRRQEAQRLGRILRPKSNPTGGFNAFFYTLISTETKEMYYSTKRQQYLIDQGYTFKILQDIVTRANREAKLLKTKEQEIDILAFIVEGRSYHGHKMVTNEAAEDKAIARMESSHGTERNESFPKPTRRISNISNLSGATGMDYSEMRR